MATRIPCLVLTHGPVRFTIIALLHPSDTCNPEHQVVVVIPLLNRQSGNRCTHPRITPINVPLQPNPYLLQKASTPTLDPRLPKRHDALLCTTTLRCPPLPPAQCRLLQPRVTMAGGHRLRNQPLISNSSFTPYTLIILHGFVPCCEHSTCLFSHQPMTYAYHNIIHPHTHSLLL
jgi:hypothetical protein